MSDKEDFGRIIEKNEIIIEDISEEDILMVAGKMEKQGNYSLEYWKAPRQTSGHLHIKNIKIPNDATIKLASKYKELIIKKYVNENLWEKVDWNFYNRREDAEQHRIATENKEHYKGYGIKTLIKTWGENKENPFEEKVWNQAIEKSKESKIPKQDVKDWNKFIAQVIPNWIEGKRQELSLSVGGYLRKEKRLGIEKVKAIITDICNRTKDTEIPMRLKGVDETFRKDEVNIKGYSGLKFLKDEKELFGESSIIEKVIRSYINKEDLTNKLLKVKPIFYDKSKMWWMWRNTEFKWELVDETDILNLVNELSFANTINSKEKTEIIEALKQGGRLNKPKEIKPTWIQFKDTIIDIETGKEFAATSEYFVTNPIPWDLNKERFIETPVMDKIFEEWVGKDYVKTLYEILAYCLIPDYPIHRLFCFIGEGLNGKSKFLQLLTKFIGEDNVTSTELDTLLTSRFEITRLHKKLVCQMGETNFSEINKTSIIKKLTGQDIIGFEYKNKNPFDSFNYAKIMIATNNLPTTTDKTVGFYRRWCIIDFPNKFSEEKDILKDIPKEEYEILAVKSLMVLKELMENRKFHNEGTIEEREKKYEEKSDPLEKFTKEFTDDTEPDGSIPKWEFEKVLNEWLKENRFRTMSDRTIAKRMKEKNVEDGRVYVDFWEDEQFKKKQIRAWLGIKWIGENKTDKTD